MKILPYIINFDNRHFPIVIKASAGVFVICSPVKILVLMDGILMNVLDFLLQKFLRIDVFRLNILPDAMLVSRVTFLLMEESQQLCCIVFSQLLKDCMSSERGEILDDFTDGSVFGFDSSVKVRGHEYKSEEQHAFLFSEPFERTKHNAGVVLVREKWPPTADCCGDEVKMSGVVKGIKCHGITAARTPPIAAI